jgi:hypothetical protein
MENPQRCYDYIVDFQKSQHNQILSLSRKNGQLLQCQIVGCATSVIGRTSELVHGISFGKSMELIDLDFRNLEDAFERVKKSYEEYKSNRV